MQKKRLEIKQYREKELVSFSPGLFPLKRTANNVKENFIRDDVNRKRRNRGQIYTEMIPSDFSQLKETNHIDFFYKWRARPLFFSTHVFWLF